MIETAFVLAAGKGERLQPLTHETPKPLVPLAGRPILDHTFDHLEKLGVKRVVVNAWHLKEQIIEFCQAADKHRPFEVLVSEEDNLLGTGGGLKKALPLIDSRPFLKMNGDSFLRGDLKGFVERALADKQNEAHWWLSKVDPAQSVVRVSNSQVVGIGSVWERLSVDGGGSEITAEGVFTGVELFHKVAEEELPEVGCIVRDYWLPRLEQNLVLGADTAGVERFMDLGTIERLKQAEALLS